MKIHLFALFLLQSRNKTGFVHRVRLESESFSVVSNSLQPHGLYSLRNPPGQNIGKGSLSLLQGIFPTQGSNPGRPHCSQVCYQLSYQGSPSVRLKCTSFQMAEEILIKGRNYPPKN